MLEPRRDALFACSAVNPTGRHRYANSCISYVDIKLEVVYPVASEQGLGGKFLSSKE